MPEMEADSEGQPPREQNLVRAHPGPNRPDPPPGRDTVRIVRIKYDEDSGALYFEPSRIEIRSDDTVVWVMEDDINEHDVVSYPDGIPVNAEPFQSPMLRARGQTWEHSFTTPGTYRYHCHPHEEAGMRGQIIVDRPSRPEEIRAPMAGGMPLHNTARP
jgi:plastocyanin